MRIYDVDLHQRLRHGPTGHVGWVTFIDRVDRVVGIQREDWAAKHGEPRIDERAPAAEWEPV